MNRLTHSPLGESTCYLGLNRLEQGFPTRGQWPPLGATGRYLGGHKHGLLKTRPCMSHFAIDF